VSDQGVATPPEIAGLTFLRPLGTGGYSEVYLYEQAMPKRQVAVKVLRDTGLTESVRRQFTAEANTMAELADHPNIVSVLAADITTDRRPYLVMTYYSRDNLGVRADRERFGVSEVLRIGIQIASAVETAHRAGILHRDIKPANILTNQYGNVGLTDFGIAAQTTAAEDDDDMGVSVPWSAPEVLYATAPASVQSDVYSLGATLWHLLVGRSPFEVVGGGDNSPLALMRRIRDLPVSATGRPDVPGALDRLLAQAMAKDPASRPPTALDLARSLQSIEQELQLPRTEVVVITEEEQQPAEDRAASVLVDDAERTRMRAPVSVNPQAPAAPLDPSPPPTPAVPSAPSTPETVRRPKVVEPAIGAPASDRVGAPPRVDATVRRPSSVDPPSDATVAPPTPPHRKRIRPAVLVAALGAVVVIAVVVGIVLASSGSDDDKRAAADATVATHAQPDDIGPPGSPTVTGTRVDPATVRFAWTYSNAADTDTFLWQYADGSQKGRSEAPELDVSSPAGTQVCVQVKVVRADGRNAALAWSEAGCAS
jgi:serine/threonine protein kinase